MVASLSKTATRNAERAITSATARDAFLDGRYDDGLAIIAGSQYGITKAQYKQIASALVLAGRHDDALRLLTKALYSEARAKEELAPLPKAKVGDILIASWGYDQTNVDYYQVVALVGTSSVRIRKIQSECVRSTTGCDYVVAKRDAFVHDAQPTWGQRSDGKWKEGHGPVGTVHRIQKSWHANEYCVLITHHTYARQWDGEPHYETAAGYGH